MLRSLPGEFASLSSPIRQLVHYVRYALPKGRSLSSEVWQLRHRAILVLLWLHVFGIFGFALVAGYSLAHSLLDAGVLAVPALIASWGRLGRRVRAAAASFGLLTASALLVHIGGGYIELHFHFFVMIGVIAFYQDWTPFLVAIGYVLFEHGVVGVLMPTAVYNHPDAWARPWKWAAIHALFVSGASIASLVNWRLSEAARAHSELVLNSVGEGIVGVDRQGMISFVNPAAARMLGWPAQQGLSSPHAMLLRHVCPSDASARDGSSPSVTSLEDGTVQQVSEAVFYRRDGSSFPVEYVRTPIFEYGQCTGAVITFKDITDRKRTEEQLKQRSLQLAKAQQLAHLGSWEWDLATKRVSWSDEFFRILGLQPDQIVPSYEAFMRHVHPDDRERVEHAVAEAVRERQPLHYKTRMLRSDGTVRIVEVHGELTFDARGAPTTMIGTAHDITERKQAEEAARTAEAEMRAIFAAMPDIILVLDRYGRYLKIPPTNPSLLYKPSSELVGRTMHEVMPAAQADVFLALIRQALETRQTVDTEYSLPIGDTEIWFAGTVAPMLEDSVVFVAHDITERKRAEATLVQLASIVESSTDAIVGKTLDGTIVSWNAGAERLYGYTAAEVVGRSVSLLLPPERLDEEANILARVRNGERIEHFETVRVRKDGTPVEISLTISPIKDAAGAISGISAIARDITERKKIDRMKNEFISTVSHELRTPLTSIRGSLGLIAGGVVGELPPQAKTMLDIAYKNSERLMRLINDILDFEKIASGKMVFVLKPVELIPLVEQSIEANRAYADQFGVTLLFEHSAPGVQVWADADRLMQVLANLLSNAAKFSPAEGTVTVGVARHDGAVRISVADQGPGIPDEFRSRIFQKFAQADASDTRQKGGTGLGLSITKAIVERLGGQIDFTTRVGVGTTFTVDLPEYCPAALPAGGAEDQPDRRRGSTSHASSRNEVPST